MVNPVADRKARLEPLTEAEWAWFMDFVYDHTDGRAEGTYEPYTQGEFYYCLLFGISQEEAEATLASYRAGDDPVRVHWLIRELPEARR